jgi:hypothetical protein
LYLIFSSLVRLCHMLAIYLTTSVTLIPGFWRIILSLLCKICHGKDTYQFAKNDISWLRFPDWKVLSCIQHKIFIIDWI